MSVCGFVSHAQDITIYFVFAQNSNGGEHLGTCKENIPKCTFLLSDAPLIWDGENKGQGTLWGGNLILSEAAVTTVFRVWVTMVRSGWLRNDCSWPISQSWAKIPLATANTWASGSNCGSSTVSGKDLQRCWGDSGALWRPVCVYKAP